MTRPDQPRQSLAGPMTPFLALDVDRLDANIARLGAHLDALGVPLRLHVKTAKSLDAVARVFPGGPGPITVSTLAEAEYFADAGYRDILYAVGLAPDKLPRAAALARRGVTMTVLLDSLEVARALTAFVRASGVGLRALIEIDVDHHRAGIDAEDPALVAIGAELAAAGALAGVLTHAGESYYADDQADRRAAAENERARTVRAAQRLREAGLDCPMVSVGSTPTAHAASGLAGVSEVRAGVYLFQDLVQAGIGVCDISDIALSVVVTVIGHQPGRGWILTDGGWMATSRDRGTADQKVDQGYGIVTDLAGEVIEDLLMTGASQEHGVLSMRLGSSRPLPELPIGTRVRVLPNHACATAAQHASYTVVGSERDAEGVPVVLATWGRINGW